jgi:hypothetical protein
VYELDDMPLTELAEWFAHFELSAEEREARKPRG